MKLARPFAFIVSSAAAVAAVQPATAAITITQGASAPTYSNVLTFDEPGGPVGNNLPTNSWASAGISSIVGYSSGFGSVMNGTSLFAWAPNSNVLYSPWGLEITFAQPVSSVSFEGYANGGNPGPFGGGTFINLYNGVYTPGTEVATSGHNAAWGGVGNAWYNITTTDGSQFDRLVFTSNHMAFPEQFINTITWTNVPSPGALALLGLAGALASRRRRA